MIRIERADPLRLLQDLPVGWAQSVITGPPPTSSGDNPGALEGLLAVIHELAHVTRRDGTLLWSVEREQPLPLRELAVQFLLCGWRLQRSQTASRCGFLLFAKGERFYWQPRQPRRPMRLRTAGSRRPWCIPADDDAGRRRLERMLLAATARSACGACGAPAAAARAGRRPGVAARCGHINPQGRCLVIDPFHASGSPLAGIAVAQGRSFLGITQPLAAVSERGR